MPKIQVLDNYSTNVVFLENFSLAMSCGYSRIEHVILSIIAYITNCVEVPGQYTIKHAHKQTFSQNEIFCRLNLNKIHSA